MKDPAGEINKSDDRRNTKNVGERNCRRNGQCGRTANQQNPKRHGQWT